MLLKTPLFVEVAPGEPTSVHDEAHDTTAAIALQRSNVGHPEPTGTTTMTSAMISRAVNGLAVDVRSDA